MNEMYIVLLAYTALGAGLKYIDDAFDEKVFSKRLAFIFAPALGILWAYSMILDPVSATILSAVLIGVFIKGKIDNYAHIIGLLVIIAIVLVAGLNLLYLPLIFLIAAVVLDEVGNDVIEYNKNSFDEARFSHKLLIYFFDQRWVTKIAILYVVLIGMFPLYYFVAMLMFDGAYLTVRLYSRTRKLTQRISIA